MQRHGAQDPLRMFDVRDDGALRTDPLFRTFHFVLAVWKRQGVCVANGESRKKSVSVERFPVLAAGASFDTGSFAQGQITGCKRIVHPECRCDLPCDKPVLSACHAPVQFRKQEHIGVYQEWMHPQKVQDPIEAHSALDIPRYDAMEVFPRRQWLGCEIFTPDLV